MSNLVRVEEGKELGVLASSVPMGTLAKMNDSFYIKTSFRGESFWINLSTGSASHTTERDIPLKPGDQVIITYNPS